ncbi:MAG: hypothetical protein B7Y42_09260 [Polaromonas sp. 28-63-22]|nr:MAG: hypothetical protein B7Y42_09260 [Polaromonas sp. 28-63-22]
MKLIIAALALAASSTAFANSCPTQMKAIDAKLASSPALAAADMAQVKQLRADGEKFHQEGKHSESMKALGSAKKILGI